MVSKSKSRRVAQTFKASFSINTRATDLTEVWVSCAFVDIGTLVLGSLVSFITFALGTTNCVGAGSLVAEVGHFKALVEI